MVVKTALGSHFGIGEVTTHFRLPILVLGLVDVHWGYDLDFDPWPFNVFNTYIS